MIFVSNILFQIAYNMPRFNYHLSIIKHYTYYQQRLTVILLEMPYFVYNKYLKMVLLVILINLSTILLNPAPLIVFLSKNQSLGWKKKSFSISIFPWDLHSWCLAGVDTDA